MVDENSTLDEILIRTIELRKLQQEMRGETDDEPTNWDYTPRGYRYGTRRGDRR